MKKTLIVIGLSIAFIYTVASCADEASQRAMAERALREATEAHAVELNAVRSRAFEDAVALAARNQTQVASEGEAWEKGFALGSARCGL